MIASHPSDSDIETAARYFRQQLGCEILDRRWRAPDGSGEAHIIAAAGGHVLHIGLIRHRAPGSRSFLKKTETERFERIARAWIEAHDARYDQVRVDLVTVMPDPAGETEAV